MESIDAVVSGPTPALDAVAEEINDFIHDTELCYFGVIRGVGKGGQNGITTEDFVHLREGVHVDHAEALVLLALNHAARTRGIESPGFAVTQIESREDE